jgi:hypothetical protein
MTDIQGNDIQYSDDTEQNEYMQNDTWPNYTLAK